MKKPNFFMIGAPKSGTSSMHEWINENPHIHMSPLKEPHFFDTDLKTNKSRELQTYENYFKDAQDHHLAIGESSTNYFYSKDAVKNILKYSPDAKFIVMIRNPVEMVYSLHQQEIFNLNEVIKDFEQAWKLQEDRRVKKAHVPSYVDVQYLLYGDRCKVGEQMERLFAQVDQKRILVIFLEDVKENPREQYLKVLQFLGVPDDQRTEFPVKNEAKGTRFKIVDWIIRTGRILISKKIIPKLGVNVARKIKLLNVKKQPRNPLRDEMKNELILYFKSDIEKLSQLVKRDLSKWLA